MLPEFQGSSARGRYGDEIVEMDHHIGLLLDALAAQGLEEDTLVVFASDNGPWLDGPVRGGSAYPLRGGKSDVWEGGFRSPCLLRWPGTLPAGKVVDELVTAMDLLPTFAGLAGAALPAAEIDGHDVWPVITAGAPSPTPVFYYYARGRLEAVRSGRFKLVFANTVRTPPIVAALYDLVANVAETTDVSAQHPEIVTEITTIADGMRRASWGTICSGSSERRTVRPAGSKGSRGRHRPHPKVSRASRTGAARPDGRA